MLLDEDRPAHGDHEVRVEDEALTGDQVDSFVQDMVQNTCGNMYRQVLGNLPRYPIPELRHVPEPGNGRLLLDIGCSWGRWSIAAARTGYTVIGVDGAFEAVRAARRVARQLGVEATFAVADARHLPFPPGTFDLIWSYSVLQHFAKEDTEATLAQVARTLKPGGRSVIEMATTVGARNIVAQVKGRGDNSPFRVRYWGPRELVKTWERLVGPTELHVDSYLFINGQPADKDLLPGKYQRAIDVSEAIKRVAARVKPLRYAADSVYLVSEKTAACARSHSTVCAIPSRRSICASQPSSRLAFSTSGQRRTTSTSKSAGARPRSRRDPRRRPPR